MKNAVVVETKDLRQILAEHFHVPQENVISSKYSYTVILDEKPETPEEKVETDGLKSN